MVMHLSREGRKLMLRMGMRQLSTASTTSTASHSSSSQQSPPPRPRPSRASQLLEGRRVLVVPDEEKEVYIAMEKGDGELERLRDRLLREKRAADELEKDRRRERAERILLRVAEAAKQEGEGEGEGARDPVGSPQPGVFAQLSGEVVRYGKYVEQTSHFLASRFALTARPYYYPPAPADDISIKPYEEGMTMAHHYPSKLIPKSVSYRFPYSFLVHNLQSRFMSDKRTQRFNKFLLEERLRDKASLVFVLRGTATSSKFARYDWVSFLKHAGMDTDALTRDRNIQTINLYVWDVNRAARMIMQYRMLASIQQNFREEIDSTFAHFDNLKWDTMKRLHLYNKQLITVLLVDPALLIRWHAVGLPTEEAAQTLREALRELSMERSHRVLPNVTIGSSSSSS
ncbi:unnamed protein product [Vitrella brassicaformis CCMP3155]|uniref:Uncharacterized protein n=1 Tax=Vitrella brassicaformis (strain CCMP3155) TaxID=1169540 RepID=A0A0G4EU47_VITBC|nr:unnamed protein product [Vitrella brassicaformis CCMP3155]|eukprot:CEM01603.1 unnamed protein product [Vitrella brassicaformis CCMP3155]